MENEPFETFPSSADSISRASVLLSSVNVKLQRRAKGIFLFTLICLVTAIVMGVAQGYVSRTGVYILPEALFSGLVLGATSAVSSLVQLVLYEADRRLGTILYEELSDALQSRRQTATYSSDRDEMGFRDESKEIQNALFHARVTFRTFAVATDLPLAPGRYGITVYALLNILSALVIAFSLTR